MKPKRKSAPENPLGEAWGLTGGIASGKSAVARILSDAGFPVVDADQVSRELTEEGGLARSPILKRFGTADRERLREIVFNDPQARKDLEAILHPLIREESLARIRREVSCIRAAAPPGTPSPPAIYEATLLIETGRFREFRGLIVVVADRPRRLERLMKRGPISRELASKILDSQISDAERTLHATRIIENNGSLDELRARVRELVPMLTRG